MRKITKIGALHLYQSKLEISNSHDGVDNYPRMVIKRDNGDVFNIDTLDIRTIALFILDCETRRNLFNGASRKQIDACNSSHDYDHKRNTQFFIDKNGKPIK